MTLGNLFGRVKFGKFSFGITGTLFVGLFLGYLLTRYSVNLLEVLGPDDKLSSRLIAVTEGQIIDKSLMQLSLLIFIIGTGLLAAKDMKYTISKYGKQFVALAIIIPLTGALTSYGCSKFFNGISPFEATGTYTGSLTSSAGLAAAVESSEVESREIAMEFPNMADESKQKVLNMINHGKKVEAELKGKEFSNELTLENTKFTSSPSILKLRLVDFIVWGIQDTLKLTWSRSATVRLMPSIVMDPFKIMYFKIFSLVEILNQRAVSSLYFSIILPTPSTCPLTIWPPNLPFIGMALSKFIF